MGGGFWIEDADGRVLLYVYPRSAKRWEFKIPDEEEALDIVRAVARAVTTAAPASGLGATGQEIAPRPVTALQKTICAEIHLL